VSFRLGKGREERGERERERERNRERKTRGNSITDASQRRREGM